MEKKLKYPRLLRRGDHFYHRAVVPQDIRDSYGKREELNALGTTDPKEAVKRVKLKIIEIDERFERHRRSLKPSATIIPTISTPHLSNYAQIISDEFVSRADVFAKADEDPAAFYRGDIIPLPDTQRFYDLTQDHVSLDRMLKYVFSYDLKDRLRIAKERFAAGSYAEGSDDPIASRMKAQEEIRALLTSSTMMFSTSTLMPLLRRIRMLCFQLFQPSILLNRRKADFLKGR